MRRNSKTKLPEFLTNIELEFLGKFAMNRNLASLLFTVLLIISVAKMFGYMKWLPWWNVHTWSVFFPWVFVWFYFIYKATYYRKLAGDVRYMRKFEMPQYSRMIP